MSSKDKSEWFLLFIYGLIIAGVIGWGMNIYAIVHSSFQDITGMLILRCIGVFLAPLGAILGYF